MPFFENADGVKIYDSKFEEIRGNNTTYNNSVHNVNSGNTTNHVTTNSNNDSSVRIGRTRNNYSRTYTAPTYSFNIQTENGSQAQDQHEQVKQRARQKAEAAVRRATEAKAFYDPYNMHSQRFEPPMEAVEDGWQSSTSQPQKSSWQMPTAQPQQPYPRTHSDPFPAPMVPPKFKSNNPFRRMTDFPVSHQSFPEWPQPAVSTDEPMEGVEGKERKEMDRYPYP